MDFLSKEKMGKEEDDGKEGRREREGGRIKEGEGGGQEEVGKGVLVYARNKKEEKRKEKQNKLYQHVNKGDNARLASETFCCGYTQKKDINTYLFQK